MAIMAGALNVLLAILLYAQYRFNRGYPGIGWWAAGQATVAAGLVVSTLRGDSLGGRAAVPMYQSLIVLGAILTYVGVLRFLGRTEPRRLLLGLWIALVTWSVYFTFVDDSPTLRSVALYLTVAAVLGATSAALWRYRLPSVRGSASYASVVFAVGSLTYLVLAAAEPTRTQVVNVFYAPSPVNAGAFLAAIATTVLWTFGLVMMINQRLAAEITLDARNMHSVFATSPDCAIISRLSDGIIDDANEGFTVLTGFGRDEVIGKSSMALALWVDPSVREALVSSVAASGSVADFPMILRRKDGSTVDCIVAASSLTLDGEPYLITVTRDVSQQRRLEAELLHEATTDGLTGLANRRHFLSVCELELRRAIRSGGSLAVAVVDIDHFKDINDTYGHAAGDAAVLAFARLVAARVRDIDTCGRLGGDEFGILLPDASLDSALSALERVRAEVAARPCLVGEHKVALTFSAGVASLTGDLDTVDSVLARADTALYEAKSRGRDCVVPALSDADVPLR